jgi:hypothetical protein
VNSKRTLKRLLTKAAILLSIAILASSSLSQSAWAGKEGVFLSETVYFTLDQVTFAPAAESSALRFTLQLHNESDYPIDFNRFGVKIMDANGFSYSAQLSDKSSARVRPHQVQSYKYIANIPAGLSADQLKVDIFEWDHSVPLSMNDRDRGALSVSAAIENKEVSRPQTLLHLKDWDSSLPDDALTAISLGQSYRVFADEAWSIYTDLNVENLGASSVKLPADFIYKLQDKNGFVYTATAAYGQDQMLLPGQPAKLTIKANVPSGISSDGLILNFLQKSNGVDQTPAAYLNIGSSLAPAKLGEPADYETDAVQGAVISAQTAVWSKQSDGFHVQTTISLTNNGSDIIVVPNLTASYQGMKGSVAISSTDNTTRPVYLSPQESTSYHFSAVLPTGVDPGALQLAVFEKKGLSSSVFVPILVTSLSGASGGELVTSFNAANDYTMGTPFSFKNGGTLDPNLEVSLVELHMHVNDDFGYKTVIAKYKLSNKGTTEIPIPLLQTELTSADGYTYTGTRQSTVAPYILPNTSYVLSYSYLMPPSEAGDKLALSVYDSNRLNLGAYKVSMQQDAVSDEPISFYPFEVKIQDYTLSYLYSQSTYSYRLRLALDIKRKEEVIVDQNFSKMTLDVVDAFGRVLGTQSLGFTGPQKLVSGTQTISFSNIKSEQFDSGISIYIYEEISTPNGPAKRLVKVLK